MRELLFKAKRTDNKEWVEGWYCKDTFGRWPVKPCIIPSENAENGYLEHVMVDGDTVCQHIGLTDKNGTKAFESDKIYAPHENRVFTIYWNKELAAFCLWDDNGWMNKDISRLSYCEIIGNIHDKEE